MTKILRIFFSLALSVAVLFFALSQNNNSSYASLLRQYLAAQQLYDKATRLNELENYGPKEEALEKNWNQEALVKFSALSAELRKTSGLYDSLQFYTSFKVGELQHYFENFGEAVSFYREAIAVKERSSLPDSLLFKPYLYAGIIFYNQNKFDTAVRFFKQAETVQANYNNRLAEAERLYNILGVLYYEKGNYKQAQNYFQKALLLLPVTNPYYNELFVNYKINLAQLHMRLEEYDKANEIYLSLLPKKINLNEINHNIGSLNLALGAAGKAIGYFRKVHYQNNKVVRLYNSIGEAFFNLNQYDSAAFYYQKATYAFQALGQNTDKVGYGLVLKNKGDLHLRNGKDTDAIRFYQQAIHQFYPTFADTALAANPHEFSGVFSYINLFNVLKAKADAWHRRYETTKNLSAAVRELDAYRSAFELINYVERTYESDESRLFLTKIKYAVHGKPIDIAFELYTKTKDAAYLELLYAFDQQNKAAVLALNRQINSEAAENNSPQLEKERQIKTEITRLAIRASQVTDSVQLAAISASIRDQEIALSKVQEELQPNAVLKTSGIPPIKILQTKLLDDKTAIVSYHLGAAKMTTLVIGKNTVACYQQPLPRNFNELMLEEIQRVKTPGNALQSNDTINLFQFFLQHVPLAGLHQLIIIPDDVLSYFPFESLRNGDHYLVQQVAVQYQFTTALLDKNEFDFANAKTLSFAPFAHQSMSDAFPQLPASAEEIAGLKGKQFIDSNATKEQFLQLSNQYKIVHLATHAVANSSAEDLSFVAFAPSGNAANSNLLYTREIYGLQLNKTGLVILSACETGGGQLVQGEGVLSLSRAFSYAGCPNIITTLWKANDFSTAYLTKKFHHYLDEDYSIAGALQQAKVDYLNDKTINPRLKHPSYWSHLVFIGNYQPEKKASWLLFAVGGLAIFSLLFLALKKPGFTRRLIHIGRRH